MKNKLLNILLIEDNPVDQLIFREHLSDTSLKNADLSWHESLTSGIKELKEKEPDLLVLDLSLPDSVGLQGLHQVRQVTATTPVIIMTGHSDNETAIDAIRQGAQDYLVKGHYDSYLLEKSIYYAMERQKLLEKLERVKLDLMNALLEGQDMERKRIAQELHDGLGQILSSACMQCEVVQKKYSDTINISAPINLLKDAVKEYRAISHNLMPPDLEEVGLLQALKKQCNQLQDSSGWELAFNAKGNEFNLRPNLRRDLYRIIQELIHNAVKHSGGNKLEVSIIQENSITTVKIKDDGKGFDCAEVAKSEKGIGLKNIKARVHAMNGNFSIDSVKGKGTTVTLQITGK